MSGWISHRHRPLAYPQGGLKENRLLYTILNGFINVVRSTPFIILLVCVMPVTKFIVGTRIGTKAAIVPLVIYTAPFLARLLENSLLDVNAGIIEAAQAMGANTLQIVIHFVLPEAFASIILALTTGLLTACSGNASSTSTSTAADTTTAANDTTSEKKELKYGKAAGPYTVLFEDAIKPILEEQGYTFTEVDFSNLLQNDLALNGGEIDFNVEQHTAYAENFNQAQNGDLVPISPIPTVPAAIFSATETSLDNIHDGARVAVPNDAANTARAYALLQKAGWITLNPDVELSTVTQDDIAENPYNIEFTEMSSTNIPGVLDDFDYAVITGSIVYNAGMDTSTALLQEDILPHLLLQVVVKEENKDAQWAKDIVAAYHSDAFKEYLDKNNNGLWYVPGQLPTT
ncbi:MetQ/NlpA family ABC transporter substrate-binding protein [Lachnospiraceae bacterium HCP1S3_A8]